MGGRVSGLRDDPDVTAARIAVTRAMAGIGTLHLGPLDYNVRTTIDELLIAVRHLERFDQAASQRI